VQIPLVVVASAVPTPREEILYRKETWTQTEESMADSVFDSAVQHSRLEVVVPSRSCLEVVSGHSLDLSPV
jgi:hypothetical protein